MTLYPTFYKFLIGLLVVLCLFLLYKSCHPSTPTPAVTENKIATDSVKRIIAVADSILRISEGLRMEDSIRQAGVIKDMSAQLSQTQTKLDVATKQHVGFANGVITAKENHDSSGYVLNCDSLAYVTNRDQYIKDSLRLKITGVVGALNRANAIANESKNDFHKQAIAYSGALSLLQKTNANLAAAATPTRKLFIGGEVFVAPGIAGVGPGVMYMDLKERQYSFAGGAATSGGWWIGGKMYFLIKLHK